ncbi:hypothetical protein LCGC14_0403460 [marine sediment metagenome]|uniref:Uncharacterized protein n=1 Tax=marine sediment metagenome TaxID=412755 RepID=A0A0F9W541_9ZZZZ
MKRFTIILMLALLTGTAQARNTSDVYHAVQVKDEVGANVTTISSVEIYAPDTTTNAVIYKDRNLQNTITIPMTTGSTNTTLVNGLFTWYGPDGYDFSITDGTNISTNANHRTRTSSEGLLIFPTYLTSISSTTYSDAQSITMGTGSDWVIRGGNVADEISFVPAADNSNFRIGTSGTALNSDFNVYVGTALGFKLDAGVPSLTWDGGAANINASSNFTTNINTGTSTGAINIGSSTAGAIALDTTAGLTANSDTAMSLTTTDGSADLTVDATAGSVIIDGGEAVADAVIIRATGVAGGIDITSLADIDITTTGTAGEDISITNTGGSIIVTATEAIADAIGLISTGGVDITAAATFDIDVTATGGRVLVIASEAAANQFKVDTTGTVAGFAQVFETTDGGIQMNADGVNNGDITLDAADIMTFTSTDVKIFDGAAAETWTIEGTSNGTDATIVFTDPTANITWTFPTGGADTVAIMASTLATNYPDIADSVTGGTNQLIFEGSDADTEETIITATDPTADIIWTLPDAGAQTVSFMSSTLATNMPEIVNSVWGGTNQLIFEGTDADTEETVLTVIDATADNTLTFADDSGGIGYIPTGSTTKDATDAAIPLTAAVVIGTSDATSSWSLPDGNPGQVLSIVIGTDGGAATLTPDSTTGDGWATMVFTNDGEGATFMFVDSTVGWAILGTFGITTNPLTTGE